MVFCEHSLVVVDEREQTVCVVFVEEKGERVKKNVSKPKHAADDDLRILGGLALSALRLQIPAIFIPRENAEKEEIAALDDVLHFVRFCVLFGGGFAPDGGDFWRPSREGNVLVFVARKWW